MYSKLMFLLWYAYRNVLMKIIVMSKFIQLLRPNRYLLTLADGTLGLG